MTSGGSGGAAGTLFMHITTTGRGNPPIRRIDMTTYELTDDLRVRDLTVHEGATLYSRGHSIEACNVTNYGVIA